MVYPYERASQKSPVRIYQELELRYFIRMAKGDFVNAASSRVTEIFTEMLAEPGPMLIYMAIVVVAGFLICSIGLQKGLERVTKFMMLALLGNLSSTKRIRGATR